MCLTKLGCRQGDAVNRASFRIALARVEFEGVIDVARRREHDQLDDISLGKKGSQVRQLWGPENQCQISLSTRKSQGLRERRDYRPSHWIWFVLGRLGM